jgi:hypothetical protein
MTRQDGFVKGIHVDFASPASGDFHAELEQEVTARVESLVAENQQRSR